MSYNIFTETRTPVKDTAQWYDLYKEQFIEHTHDQTTFSLVTPDDSLIFVGPPRLAGAKEGTDAKPTLYAVGLVNSFNYNESSQVQPMKAIGSRRHIFARTNAPVSGSIGRLMVLGSNMYRALYALAEYGSSISDRNSKFAVGGDSSSSWFTNLEEDLFRIPFGLGIIYNSPATIAGSTSGSQAAGAEYIEMIQLQNRSVGFASGGAMIMEQVSFIADRVIPWSSFQGVPFGSDNPVGEVMS